MLYIGENEMYVANLRKQQPQCQALRMGISFVRCSRKVRNVNDIFMQSPKLHVRGCIASMWDFTSAQAQRQGGCLHMQSGHQRGVGADSCRMLSYSQTRWLYNIVQRYIYRESIVTCLDSFEITMYFTRATFGSVIVYILLCESISFLPAAVCDKL